VLTVVSARGGPEEVLVGRGVPSELVPPELFLNVHVPTWQPVVAALTALPLAARRRYPLPVFWVVIAATLLLHGGVHSGRTAAYTLISTLFAAYSAATYSAHRRVAVASVVVGAGLIGFYHRETLPSIGSTYFPFVVVAGVGLAANVIYTWKQRIRTLEAEQAVKTRQAIEQERARIARELHDVVTHNVSMMVIQAGAARKILDQAPDQAREALLSVEAGGRTAMTELRHVMDLLTLAGDGPESAVTADLAPQPGLEQVGALVERVRQAGVPVDLTINGGAGAVPAGVDLAAYRVVQEALTNTLKHASGARVSVAIARCTTGVVVDVTDTGGIPSATAGSGSGRGLEGLRQRLDMYGATLQAGPRPSGGYRVRAEFPLPTP
ncbi:MAG: histidine kinase, partial [Acidimicrobiaceae bacterium]|nr:histidine kinase [Acidimicrobiaceae bacterium]